MSLIAKALLWYQVIQKMAYAPHTMCNASSLHTDDLMHVSTSCSHECCAAQLPPDDLTPFFLGLKDVVEALAQECSLHDYDGWVRDLHLVLVLLKVCAMLGWGAWAD